MLEHALNPLLHGVVQGLVLLLGGLEDVVDLRGLASLERLVLDFLETPLDVVDIVGGGGAAKVDDDSVHALRGAGVLVLDEHPIRAKIKLTIVLARVAG